MSRTSTLTSKIMNRLLLVAAALAGVAFGLSTPACAQEDDGQEVSGADRPTAERCSAPEFRQFDFWLGRWEVRNPDGEIVGHNEIRRVSGGCGLLESWESVSGGTGVSINTYDSERERWTQRWVGSGATLWLEGDLEEGPDGARMVLSGTEPRSTPRGEVMDRISWTPLRDGRVLQVWEVQSIGGGDWEEIFHGLYTRINPGGAGSSGGRGSAAPTGGPEPDASPQVERQRGETSPSLVARVQEFRSLVESRDFGAARAMMAPNARRWFAPREGEGQPWTVGESAGGPWARWDEHFGSEGEVVEWTEGDGLVTAVVRETNDYYRLLERGALLNTLTYHFDDDGLLEALVIGSAGDRDPGRTEEFLAWARENHPEEIAVLMPEGEIDPSGDHPERFRRLLERWRRELGQSPD